MPIPRLRAADTVLLVIDVQERLLPTISERERLVANAALLLEAAAILGVPAAVTEQYPRGLGRTSPEVLAAAAPGTPLVAKTRFSAVVPEIEAWLAAAAARTVLVCGIEAHVCVLQTALDLRAGGEEMFFATDAISAGQVGAGPPAFRRMEAAGAVPTGVLSALYEWMGDKEHPAFPRALDVAKRVRA